MSVAQLRCGREWPGAMLFAFAPVQVVWLRVCGGFSQVVAIVRRSLQHCNRRSTGRLPFAPS